MSLIAMLFILKLYPSSEFTTDKQLFDYMFTSYGTSQWKNVLTNRYELALLSITLYFLSAIDYNSDLYTLESFSELYCIKNV